MIKFGRNQLISIVSGGAVFVASLALVFTADVTGQQWLEFVQWFLPSWLGVTLGASAVVKSAGALGGKPSDNPTPPAPGVLP